MNKLFSNPPKSPSSASLHLILVGTDLTRCRPCQNHFEASHSQERFHGKWYKQMVQIPHNLGYHTDDCEHLKQGIEQVNSRRSTKEVCIRKCSKCWKENIIAKGNYIKYSPTPKRVRVSRRGTSSANQTILWIQLRSFIRGGELGWSKMKCTR